MDFQKDCRFFSGYKPCGKNEVCSSSCEKKEVAFPRILIIHLEALGAVLRGTVLLPAIKRRWPNCHITWITQPIAAPLLQNNSYIDRLLKNDYSGNLALSVLSFDYSLCLDKSLEASGLLEVPKDSGSRRGFGTEAGAGVIVPLNKEAQRLYELGLSNHEKFFVNKKPETALLTEAMGFQFERDNYLFCFTDSEEKWIKDERKRLGLKSNRPVIGLNTGCSSTLPNKKLTIEGWTTLTRKVQRHFPFAQVILLGGPEDTERNESLARAIPEVIFTPTSNGLRQGMGYVSLCDVVVTGDSLGMHMAIALKKWTVAWFGPTCAHEIDFYGRGISVVTKAPCSPCWKRQCSQSVMCYDQVDYDEVLRGIEKGLTKEKNLAVQARKPAEITL